MNVCHGFLPCEYRNQCKMQNKNNHACNLSQKGERNMPHIKCISYFQVGHMNLEEQFHQLGCKLRLLEKDSDEYKVRIGIV